MKRKIKAIALAALALACAYGLARIPTMLKNRSATAGAERNGEATQRVGVQIAQKGDLAVEIKATGQIAPLAEISLVPKAAGRIERFRLPTGQPVEEGSQVAAGDIMAEIEHAALLAAVNQAAAALEVARVNRADAEREKKRWDALFAERSATEQQRDKATTAFQLAQAQFALAEAALQQAKVALDETTLKAPIAGIVSRKFVDEGTMVGPATPLVNIADIDTVKVLAMVGERHLAKLRPDETSVRAEVDAFPSVVFTGTVHRLGTVLDPVTRTAEVEVRLPNPGRRLKPGMFVRTTILLEKRSGVIVIPEHALMRGEEGLFAYVVDNSRVQKRALKVGLSQGALNEVLEGIAAGEMVVIRGQRGIKDGEIVAPVVEEGAR